MKNLVRIICAVSLFVPAFAFAQSSPNPFPTLDTQTSSGVEARIRQYFADIPVMASIAKCESSFRQYGSNGLVLFDPSYSMIGAFQVSAAHMPEALSMGMDVTTLEGNMAYARHLYNSGGTDPWLASFRCWGGMPTPAPSSVAGTTTSTTSIIRAPSAVSLTLGVTSPEVLEVQQLLNKTGFTVAVSGPGSVGQETNKFGTLTRAAVRKFQCAQNIVCSGDEATTGYGFVNDRTYEALKTLANASTAPSPVPPSASNDKAVQVLQLRSQISALQAQIDALNAQIKQLGE
jgi:hypothetical protein